MIEEIEGHAQELAGRLAALSAAIELMASQPDHVQAPMITHKQTLMTMFLEITAIKTQLDLSIDNYKQQEGQP